MGLVKLALGCVLAIVSCTSFAESRELLFGSSGVPKSLGETRDYDRIFSELSNAGIEIFFPTFQTQEAPTPQTLGLEVDFMAPCRAESPAFEALRRHGMRLLVPGELIYPAGAPMPPLEADPLRELIECAGRGSVFGVLNYDEPAHTGKEESLSKTLFERVKEIDATLPVLMVHAPIVLDQDRHKTEEGRQAYLEEVARQSAYADIVGFDVYPVPESVALIGTPFSGDQVVDPARAVRDYMEWIRQNIPDKKHLVVLQGFSYKDQYDPLYFELIGQHVKSIVRPPNRQETLEMARLGIEGGASVVIWWGQSFLEDEAAEPWPAILDVPRELGRN